MTISGIYLLWALLGALWAPSQVEVVARDWTEASLREAWAEAGSSMWVEGDVLTFCWEQEASRLMTTGSIQKPMNRLGRTNLWTLSVRVKDLDRAVIGYSFLDPQKMGTPLDSFEWRGKNAPKKMEVKETLDGEILRESMPMGAIDEERGLTVYLPPGHDPEASTPVVYMADGQSVEAYAKILEPMIEKGLAPKTMLVGVHCGDYRGDRREPRKGWLDMRTVEYLVNYHEVDENADPGRFDKHADFFVEDVIAWAEDELGASSERESRAVFGCSNGAAFAVTMGHRHADVFGHVMVFSLAWQFAMEDPIWEPEEAPRHYLVAGILEESFYRETTKYRDMLIDGEYDVAFRDRISGHDGLMWREEFVGALVWAFGLAR